jgi:hypothetical protein
MYSDEFQLGNAQKELEVYIQDKSKQGTNERTLLEHYVMNPWNAYITGLWCTESVSRKR